jgi:hypothetical protein
MLHAGEDVEQQELSPLLVRMQNVTATSEGSWQFLTNQNMFLPFDPTIALLGIF